MHLDPVRAATASPRASSAQAMIRRAPLGLALVLSLSACQSYVAQPLRLDAYPAALEAGRPRPAARITPWRSADLLQEALAYNPRIRQAEARWRTAAAAARTARNRPAMTLALTVEYAEAEEKQWLHEAGAEIPLDYGARKRGRWTDADLAALQAFYDYQDVVWSVRAELARSRAGLTAAEAELDLARRLVDVRTARAAQVNERVVAGKESAAAAHAAAVELGAALRGLADTRLRAEQSRLALAHGLGLPGTELSSITFTRSDGALPGEALGDLQQRAVLGRPDVLRAVADYDMAEAALRTEVARQYPEVWISPGYAYDHGVRKLPFSLGLALPPLDLNRAAIAQAEARRAEAGRSLEAAQAGVLAAVDQARAVLTWTETRLALVRDHDLKAALAAEADATRAQAAHGADELETLTAQAARLEAELALIEARWAADLAAIDLEDALRTAADPGERDLLRVAFKRLGDGG